MSLRGSASPPARTSGAMYCGVPTMWPCSVTRPTVDVFVDPSNLIQECNKNDNFAAFHTYPLNEQDPTVPPFPPVPPSVQLLPPPAEPSVVPPP